MRPRALPQEGSKSSLAKAERAIQSAAAAERRSKYFTDLFSDCTVQGRQEDDTAAPPDDESLLDEWPEEEDPWNHEPNFSTRFRPSVQPGQPPAVDSSWLSVGEQEKVESSPVQIESQ
eukprot:2420287-Pyramimonas_sp.AAC.1